LGLKILQAVFAEPPPVKAFRGVGEGGTLKNLGFPKMKPPENAFSAPVVGDFFVRFPQLGE
jgi:hypothetical protein